jgi:hypothetical protein
MNSKHRKKSGTKHSKINCKKHSKPHFSFFELTTAKKTWNFFENIKN